MPIDENGFLGKEIEAETAKIVNNHREFFELAKEINKAVYIGKKALKSGNRNRLQLAAFCLYIRIHESFQAVIILLSKGLVVDAKVVLRSIIEATFHIKILSEDKDHLKKYIYMGELDRLRNLKKAQEHESSLIQDYISELTDEDIKRLEQEFEEVKNSGAKVNELAELAGMKDKHIALYHLLSNAVHASSIETEKYLIRDNMKHKMFILDTGPQDKTIIEDIILWAIDEILIAQTSINSIFSIRQDDKLVALSKEHARLSNQRSPLHADEL